MYAYGISRKDVWSLEWWAGSKSSTGNKTTSHRKRRARRAFKKAHRQRLKRELDSIVEPFHQK